MKDHTRVIVVNWHRQKGKDFTTSAKAVDDAMVSGEDWFIVSLTQRQADATFRKCLQHAKAWKTALKLAGSITRNEYETGEFYQWADKAFAFKAREIILPNGARIVSLPGRDPDTLAGLTGNVIFTEFGLFPNGGYEHWRVVFPLITRGFRCIIISTPRGKDTKFYELCNDPETYSYHFCDIHKSVATGFVLRDNNGQPTTLERFKRLYGDDVGWTREYECQFTGDLEALIRWAKIEAAAKHGQGMDFDYICIERGTGWRSGLFDQTKLPKGGRLEIGWDVARNGDLAALWVNHVVSNRPRHLRYLVTMHDTEFSLQRSIICEAMDAKAASQPSVGKGDSTGLGMSDNEALENQYPNRWEGVPFTTRSRSELCSGLRMAFGDGDQTLPDLVKHKFIGTDVYALQAQPSDKAEDKTLKITYTENSLLPDSHCDIAMAGALSISSGSMSRVQGVIHVGPSTEQAA